MKDYLVKTQYGNETVQITLAKYANGNLAIQLVCDGWEPFAIITKNFEQKLIGNMAYVDKNNCPWVEQFIKENELGERVEGEQMYSGFCEYPLYRFDLKKLKQ